MTRRALILYAGIGGFCQNIDWTGWEVDAVEIDPAIAKCYHDRFPDHNVFTKGGCYLADYGGEFLRDDSETGDAHQFLLERGHEYDFIQSSPPCQTHSRLRYALGVCAKSAPRSQKRTEHAYCDAMLWQEIIFMATHPRLKPGAVWLVENVNPYYDYLVKFAPQYRIKLDRHFVWTNANLPVFFNPKDAPKAKKFSEHSKYHRIKEMSLCKMKAQTGIDLSVYPDIKNKRQVLRNMFEPELAACIFNAIYRKDGE
jgi:DNA (cytosine-5)-methyltransferase 1